MRVRLLGLADHILYTTLVCIFLLPPLLTFPSFPASPVSGEASQELMKQASLIFLGSLLLVTWLLRSLLLRSIRVTFSLLLLLYLIFVLIIGVSTFLSLDPITSLLALHTQAPPSVVTIFILAIIFIIMTNQVFTISWVLRLFGVMSITGSVIAAASLARNLLSPSQPTLTLVGSQSAAAWVVASISPITWALLLIFWSSVRRQHLIWLPRTAISAIFLGSLTIQFIFLLVTNTINLWLSLTIATLSFIVLLWQLKSLQVYRQPFILVVTALTLIILGRSLFFPITPTQSLPLEVTVPIAVRTLYSDPVPWRLLFGSGPATFFLAVTKHIPSEALAFQAFDFGETSNNAFLELLTTSGILGLTAYLFLFFGSLVLILKTLKGEPARTPKLLLTGALGSLLIWFAGGFTATPTTSVLVLFVAFMALIVVLAKITSTSLTKTITVRFGRQKTANLGRRVLPHQDLVNELLPIVLFLLSVLTILFLLFITSRLVGAELAFYRSKNAIEKGNVREAYAQALSAVHLNPYADYVHRHLAATSLALAGSLLQPTQGQTLVDQALREAKTAVKVGNKRSVNWAFLGNMYASLGSSVPQALEWSLKAYERAKELEPENKEFKQITEILERQVQGQVAGEKTP